HHYEETTDHITSGCPELAKSVYIQRHNKVASYIHWNICKDYNIKVGDKWTHRPETITENGNESCTILWGMPVNTKNRNQIQQIIIRDQELKKCLLIDMAVSAEQITCQNG
ncbi:unnamed protein product, partial [Porites lobata]